MRFQALASGSNGNCSVLSTSDGALLIDAGISRSRIVEGLKDLKIKLSDVRGILITHAHSDHISGLPVLHNFIKAPVIATPQTIVELSKLTHRDSRYGSVAKRAIKVHEFGDLNFGSFEITSFPTDHDIGGSSGYFVAHNNLQFSYATDTGTLSKEFIDAMSLSDIVVLESNHDKDLLQKSRRPIWLKKRIRETHLSNDETQNLLKQIINEKTKCVYFAHLSGQCNSLHHVFDVIKDLTKKNEYEHWKWSICPRYEKSSTLNLTQDKATLEGGLHDGTISKRMSEMYSEHQGLRGYFE